jgi:hypothetical protein
MLFLLNIAWIAAHELDAIAQQEWRFFAALSPIRLSETNAYQIFVLAHIPLFVLVIAAAGNIVFQVGFDLFLLVHAGLHWSLRNHPKIKFKNWFSWLLIGGAALSGALHLVLLARG